MLTSYTNRPQGPRQRGATLVEALIAFAVMAVGLSGLVAMQARLRVNSDVAKQRAEAVRLAEEDLEDGRAFGILGVDTTLAGPPPITFRGYASVTTGTTPKALLATSVTTTTNATYTINRSVVDSTTANMKDVRVTVDWTDRNNTAQRVVLRSLIAGIDPRLAAAMAIPPNGSPVKDPLGRDIQVPIPAKNLGDSIGSVFKPVSNGPVAYVFDNQTGLVKRKCTVATNTYTAALTNANLRADNCTDISAVLLSGYVRFSLDNNPDATNPNDAPPGALGIRLDLDNANPASGVGTLTQLTAPYWVVDRGAGYTAPECAAEDSKTVTFTTPVNYSQVNNGVTQTVSSTRMTVIVPAATALTAAAIAPFANLAASAVTDITAAGDRYVAYTCVVYPRAIVGRAPAWTGRSLITPAGWTIGTTASDHKVCRYSTDYNLNGYIWTPADGPNITEIDNSEHPYAYLMESGSLSNQNFLVIKGNRSCPTDGPVEVDGTGGENYTDETTVLHQS